MPELYLRLLNRILTPVLLLLALFLLVRGHNLPGGGFIAGLMAAAAFELQILSRDNGGCAAPSGRISIAVSGWVWLLPSAPVSWVCSMVTFLRASGLT